MRKLLTTAALTLTLACAAYGPTMLQTAGPLQRQVERVVARHDAYVMADTGIAAESRLDALEQSADVRSLISMPEVSAESLAPVLAPVLDRHDLYVEHDSKLDQLERDSYLGSSAGLRSLMSTALQR